MGQETSIEWCHHTLNVWRGCAKVHAGCTNCYAEKNIGVTMQGIQWGEVWQGGQRVVMADSGWENPPRWARAAAKAGERRRVFCSSLADVLEVPPLPPGGVRLSIEEASAALVNVRDVGAILNDARSRLWDTIRQTALVSTNGKPFRVTDMIDPGSAMRDWPGMDWLILTKRPENWHLVPEDVRPLVWLGTSISDQKTADEWVPRLLAAEGFRLRFLSVEPLVGPVDLSWFLRSSDGFVPNEETGPVHVDEGAVGVDWVIVGGESGPKARPCAVEWVRDIVRQCREAGVPCFVKQLGGAPATSIEPTGNFRTNAETGRRQIEMAVSTLDLADKKGGDIAEWPVDLRVREVPEGR